MVDRQRAGWREAVEVASLVFRSGGAPLEMGGGGCGSVAPLEVGEEVASAGVAVWNVGWRRVLVGCRLRSVGRLCCQVTYQL